MPWCLAVTGLRAATGGASPSARAGGTCIAAGIVTRTNVMRATVGIHASGTRVRGRSRGPSPAQGYHLGSIRLCLAFGAGKHAAADAIGKVDQGRILAAATLEPHRASGVVVAAGRRTLGRGHVA